MYIPPLYRVDDRATLLAFMAAHAFATLVSVVDGAPFATHLPVVIEERDNQVVISGHLAKPNAQWQHLDQAQALVIFGGPHAYIAPALYEKEESVPTWNYIAVHAYGTPTLYRYADAPQRVEAMLEAMIRTFDAGYFAQWAALPDKFRSGMMQGIIGFEVVVTRLEGKAKLSQNRSVTDQASVAAHLVQASDPAAAAVGAAMQHNLTQGKAR